MAIFLFNCQKCTNVYTGFSKGKLAQWCKPTVDGVKDKWEWEWHDEDTKKDTCRCKYYTENMQQGTLYLI